MDLPKEDHQDGTRGRLKKAMCGTRVAAQNWELDYSETMVEAGFTQGTHSVCVPEHKETGVALSYMEMILQYLDQGVGWIGFAKSLNVAWR